MLPKQKQNDNKTNHKIEYNNFMNSTNNNNKSKNDHKTLERIQNQSVQFNNEQEFDNIARDVANASNKYEYITGCNCKSSNDRRVIENAYENLQAYELSLSKQFLLERYFRSDARTQAIYENLCRGCGYGVFTSQGDLCNFCECIVNGVHSTNKCENSSANIYENICESCSRIFSTPECSCNETKVKTVLISDLDDSNKKQETEENQQQQELEKKKIKLVKSKSFGKREKRSIFHSIFGTLRGVQRTNSEAAKHSYKNGVTIKPLEIVHHVDGHDNVFRTQETFDLQRICELKRTQTSCSDQHIYGRLKSNDALATTNATAHSSNTLPTQLTHTQEQLVNQSISIENFKPKKQLKRPRISKPRLLRTKSQNDALDTLPKPMSTTHSNQSLYLNESICNWMSSLRQNIHYYEDNLTLCFPKSIPAKSNIIYCSTADSSLHKTSITSTTAPINLLTNCRNIDNLTACSNKSQQDIPYSDVTLKSSSSESCNDSDDFTTVTLRRDQQQKQQQQQQEVFSEQTNSAQQVAEFGIEKIILEFKRQLIAKQMQNQQNQQQPKQKHQKLYQNQINNDFAYTKGLKSQQQQQEELKQMQRAQPKLRSKRQAIYLKIDDTLSNANLAESNTIRESESINTSTSTLTNNSNNNNNTVNYTEKETNSHSANANLSQLVSRSTIHQVITTVANKRCGYYDLNSDFVNDILNAFDTFLLRNDDDQLETETVNEINKAEIESVESNKKEDNLNLSEAAIQQINVNATTERANTETTKSVIDNVNNVVVNQQNNGIPCAINQQNACLTENSLICTSKDNLGSVIVPSSTCFDSCALLALNTNADTAKITALDIKVPECEQIFDLFELINQQLLSFSLNRAILFFDKYLSVFLCAISDTECYRLKYARYSFERLLKKYRRFYAYCHVKQQSHSIVQFKTKGSASKQILNTTTASVLGVVEQSNIASEKLINKQTIKNQSAIRTTITQQFKVNVTQDDIISENCVNEFQNSNKNSLTYKTSVLSDFIAHKVRPKVPQRDPKTILSKLKQLTPSQSSSSASSPSPPPPQLPAKKLESHLQKSIPNMTVPTTNLNPTTTNTNSTLAKATAADIVTNTTTTTTTTTTTNNMQKTNSDEEGIYQTIWHFKTVGEVQERYETDADYYEINTNNKAAVKSLHINDDSSSTLYDVEDHGEWETDDEFMFTTQFECDTQKTLSTNAGNDICSSTIRSTHSSSSATGSTITGFGSSTTTLASVISTSLKHHLFRSIGIFYSLTEPKLRAIIYDYERNHASTYFAKPTITTVYSNNDVNANDSGLGKSPKQYSPVPPPRTTSAKNNDKNNMYALCPLQQSESVSLQSLNKLPVALTPPPPPLATAPAKSKATVPSKFQLLPDSVLAWQFMLLDVHYLEDEEDMIVSESEILRAQEIKDDIDTRQTQQLNILQRFKSASIGNLIDLPNDDDKKSIKERMRNKLQRGVFKLNVRSPKSEKKSRGIFRRAEATSLYLEDGMKPKYPIFAAPLEQLELNQTTQPNVPRFVVDCIEYIERKDCIQQDGLYRASGNKVSVDELKQKLSESYIYDPKLLITDDIHTLTSLLKQFFRELGAPLIPQATYERLGHNLTDATSIETMRIALDEINEPNRSTLKFLIKHLTNVAAHSSSNRMPASNLAIVWGPCLLSANQIEFDIGRMNTLAKFLIENYERIFASNDNERLVS